MALMMIIAKITLNIAAPQYPKSTVPAQGLSETYFKIQDDVVVKVCAW